MRHVSVTVVAHPLAEHLLTQLRDRDTGVVVGDLERQIYGDAVETRFANVLPIAFRSGSITIYRAR